MILKAVFALYAIANLVILTVAEDTSRNFAGWYFHSALDGALTVEFPVQPNIVAGKAHLAEDMSDAGVDQWSAQVIDPVRGVWAVTYFRLPKSNLADMAGANFISDFIDDALKADSFTVSSKTPVSGDAYLGTEVLGKGANGISRRLRYCYGDGIFVIMEYGWRPNALPDDGVARFMESLTIKG